MIDAKLREAARTHAKEYDPLNWSKAHIDCFEEGAKWQAAQTDERVNKLVEALRSICGNRCAEQNPCEAREALKEYEGKT